MDEAVSVSRSGSMSSSSSNSDVLFLHFQDLIDAALRDYSRKTGKDIVTDPLTARLLRCDSSDAVLGVLQEQAHAFDQFRNGDWKIQLMRRLKPTVDILLGLSTSGVFGEGIGLRFPPAKAIFAGIGLLLAAAKGVSTSYDALIELFQCFEHYLARLKVLTEIPSAVGEILVKIMIELLEVLALATQQISQGRFKKFAKKLLGENDVEAVLQRLDRLTMEESRMTATQTMEVVYGLFNNMKVVMDDGKASIDHIREALVMMQKISDDLNKMKCDQLREKIQEWLSPPDPSINHNTACEAHHNGTATWFLEGNVYNEWKATGSLLWTHGNPGSGKSVLCSSIIKDIESIRATGLASVAYYYFDFKDARKQDRRGLLSSLLNQLCTRSHRGYDILSSLYEAHDDGSRQPSEVDLIQCLKTVLALPCHGKAYIIVDALDESPNKPGIPSPREKVLRLVEELVDLRHPDIRVCITSRPEVDIQMVLEPLASQAVTLHNAGGQWSDIIDYIKSVVQSDANMRKWRPEDRQMVIDSLSKNANGMFRWVVCQLDRLRRSFPASIRQALNELPRTLDETYERILLEIDEEKRVYTIRLFQCLAFSRQPLCFRELAEVLTIQFGTEIPTLNTSFRPEDAYEAILSACSTLVTTGFLLDRFEEEWGIVDNRRTHYESSDSDSDHPFYDYDDLGNFRSVQFSHYSVKEFLTSARLAKSDKGDISQFYISPEPAHTILAQSCITTLLQPKSLPVFIQGSSNIRNIVDNYPLAVYAAENWFHHAWCGVASQIQDVMKRLFDPDRIHIAIWLRIRDIDWFREEEKRSPLYYAALCGIESVVEHLVITCRQDPNQSHGSLGTPLHAAVVSGHIQIVQLLLSLGADVNALDERGDSPLHTAVLFRKPVSDVLGFEGTAFRPDASIRSFYVLTPIPEDIESRDLDVAQLLISRGADINALDRDGVSPLSKAVKFQKPDFVALLLKSGADVNIRSLYSSTPLHEAVSLPGDLDVAQSLISHGADVNAPKSDDDIGERISPLHIAVNTQRPDFVELLLKVGADVNVRNIYDSTPLHEAAKSGNLDIVQLFITHGADINTLDCDGDSLLSKAVIFKKPEIVELLLKNGADVNIRSLHSSTPLHEAVSLPGDLDIAQSLISHGADVNALESDDDIGERRSPLHIAVNTQRPDFVELLLKVGADVNARNYDSTPLHEAAESGNLDIVQLLITHGADINALDGDEGSPLFIAVIFKKPDLVELLLKSGADVNIRGFNSSTPLHEAVSLPGDLNIAQSLISHGADVNALESDDDIGERRSPLHIAVNTQRPDFVELLLKVGADVNARNIYDSTPLHEAAEFGNLDIVQLLITHGADINALDCDGDSPLSKGVRFKKPDFVELLLKSGADVNIRGLNSSTPLHEAVSLPGDFDIAQSLISHGADVNALESDDDIGERLSPLHIAVNTQRPDLVELLLKVGADVNARNYDSTPLHEAAESGNLDIVQLLITHGADINALDGDGDSPLSKGVRFKKPDLVELLLKSGADVNIRGLNSSTPLHEAVSLPGDLDIAQSLISHGADVNALESDDDIGERRSPLHIAVNTQRPDFVELLLKVGADVNIRNIYDSTPLHEAVESENSDIVQLLITHGADINALNDQRSSPLHYAAQHQSPDVVELLLKGGAEVNLRNMYNSTPLHEAVDWGSLDTLRSLLTLGQGADVNAQGRSNRNTPLHLASLKGFLDKSRLLIEHGADVDAQNNEGRTPFSVALANGHRKLALFLSNDRVPEDDV